MKKEPFRALDRIEAPDQWQQIVERAGEPDTEPWASPPSTPAKHHRTVLALAGSCIAAVVVLVVVLVVVTSGDGRGNGKPDGVRTASSPSTVPPGPASIVGPDWQVISISEAGQRRPLAGGFRQTFKVTGQQAYFTGCNGAGTQVRIEGSRLVSVGGVAMTQVGCFPSGLNDQDEFFAGFLRRSPTIRLDGNDLELQAGTDVVSLHGFPGSLPAPGSWPDGTAFRLTQAENGSGFCVRVGEPASGCLPNQDPTNISTDPTSARRAVLEVSRAEGGVSGAQNGEFYGVAYGALPVGARSVVAELEDGTRTNAGLVMAGGAWALPLPVQPVPYRDPAAAGPGPFMPFAGVRISYVFVDGSVVAAPRQP